MPYVSIHGRRLGFDDNGLLFDGSPVGGYLPAGPRGKVFFVDSNIAASEGTSPATAVATIDAAINLCTAAGNIGDTIYVMPGHTEAVTSSEDCDIDVGNAVSKTAKEGAEPQNMFNSRNL